MKVKIAGGPAPVRVTKDIEALLGENPVLKLHVHQAEKKDLTALYLKYVSAHLITKKIGSFKGKVAVDYMYGSAAGYVENFLPAKQVIALHNTHDPTFGGTKPEPTEKNLAPLKKVLAEKKAALGIAFDGDGDRVALLDEKGTYLTPCLIAAVICDYLIKHKKLKGNIVQTLSMGFLLKRMARAHNMLFEEVNVGFKHVAERIELDDVAFGVEESGGFSWKGNLPDRDGLSVALAFLEIMGATGKKASELCADIAKEYGASVYLRREEVRQELLALGAKEDEEFFRRQMDSAARYANKGCFFLPEACRWETISAHPADNRLNVDLDNVINRLETDNESLRGALPQKIFTDAAINPNDLKKVIDEIGKVTHKTLPERDLIGRVYE